MGPTKSLIFSPGFSRAGRVAMSILNQKLPWKSVGFQLSVFFGGVCFLYNIPGTRWAPTSYKWSYNPYKWPYKWVPGVITPINGVINLFITGRGPPCTDGMSRTGI